MKRNIVVGGIVLGALVVLGAAGWANWENRRQAAARRMAEDAQAVLIPASDSTPAHYQVPLVGKSAPNFTLSDLKGNKVSLASFRGKAVQLNFWATWCAPCKIETPWLIELEKKYSAQGFEVIGVSFDDLTKDDPKALAKDKAEIARGAAALHIPYPVLIDGDSIDKAYGDVDVFPTSFFIDRKGTIVAASVGLTSKDELEGNIQKALGAGK